jgi:hypothetical protein
MLSPGFTVCTNAVGAAGCCETAGASSDALELPQPTTNVIAESRTASQKHVSDLRNISENPRGEQWDTSMEDLDSRSLLWCMRASVLWQAQRIPATLDDLLRRGARVAGLPWRRVTSCNSFPQQSALKASFAHLNRQDVEAILELPKGKQPSLLHVVATLDCSSPSENKKSVPGRSLQ